MPDIPPGQHGAASAFTQNADREDKRSYHLIVNADGVITHLDDEIVGKTEFKEGLNLFSSNLLANESGDIEALRHLINAVTWNSLRTSMPWHPRAPSSFTPSVQPPLRCPRSAL